MQKEPIRVIDRKINELREHLCLIKRQHPEVRDKIEECLKILESECGHLGQGLSHTTRTHEYGLSGKPLFTHYNKKKLSQIRSQLNDFRTEF